MQNYIIPTTIVDDFFNDPKSVVKFALSQDFKHSELSIFPGLRTKPLHEINPELFTYIHNKFFNLFYPAANDYGYVANSYFQLVDSSYNEGWIHSDSNIALITAIIYLNENPNKESGTTIYSPKQEEFTNIYTQKKEDFYAGKLENDTFYRIENNQKFQEEIVVKNKFNRLIAFDSHLYHGANDFKSNETRLTLVTFISKINADKYPIQRMKCKL